MKDRTFIVLQQGGSICEVYASEYTGPEAEQEAAAAIEAHRRATYDATMYEVLDRNDITEIAENAAKAFADLILGR